MIFMKYWQIGELAPYKCFKDEGDAGLEGYNVKIGVCVIDMCNAMVFFPI